MPPRKKAACPKESRPVVPQQQVEGDRHSEATKICVRGTGRNDRHQRHDQQQDQGDQADQGGHGEVTGEISAPPCQVFLGERLIFSGRPNSPHGRTTRIATISR